MMSDDIYAKTDAGHHHSYNPHHFWSKVNIVHGESADNLLQSEDIHEGGAGKPGDAPAAQDDWEEDAGIGKMYVVGQHSTCQGVLKVITSRMEEKIIMVPMG